MSTDVTPFSRRPGFVLDEASGTAAHYGNPLVEQRTLAQGRAVVEVGTRGVLTVSGPDRLSWLDSLTSQSLKGLAPGQSSETLLLDPSGRLEHAAGIVDDGETAWLLVESAEVADFAAWLDRMRFMLRVEVADRSADFAVLGSFADLSLPAASPAGVPLVWVDPWHEVGVGGVGYAAVDSHPGRDWTYRETLVARGDLSALAIADVPAEELPVAGLLALEALRIAAWRPRLTTEVDERSIPHELDWLRSAVHLEKGCYRGQETVAKVHNLGHPPRRIVMLHLDGSDSVLPAHGDAVVLPAAPGAGSTDPDALADREVGRITSSAVHYELGPIALAVVKRTTDPKAALTVVTDEIRIAAAQETIVPPGAGASANVPRLPRLGAVRR